MAAKLTPPPKLSAPIEMRKDWVSKNRLVATEGNIGTTEKGSTAPTLEDVVAQRDPVVAMLRREFGKEGMPPEDLAKYGHILASGTPVQKAHMATLLELWIHNSSPGKDCGTTKATPESLPEASEATTMHSDHVLGWFQKMAAFIRSLFQGEAAKGGQMEAGVPESFVCRTSSVEPPSSPGGTPLCMSRQGQLSAAPASMSQRFSAGPPPQVPAAPASMSQRFSNKPTSTDPAEPKESAPTMGPNFS